MIIDSTSSLASTALNLGTGGTFNAAAKSTFAMDSVVGSGTIDMGGGAFTVSQSLSVGNSPGALSVNGDLTLTTGTTTTMELASTLGLAGTDFDQVSVSGLLTLEGALAVVSWNGFNIDQFGTYDLFNFGSVDGNFDSVTVGGTALTFDSVENWTGTGTGGWQYGFNINTGVLTVVPEPTVPGLVGLAALGLLRRRRNA